MEPGAAISLLDEGLREIQLAVTVEIPSDEKRVVDPIDFVEVPALVGFRGVAVLGDP
jgi:hypothetical protein